MVNKVKEGRPHIVDRIKNDDISLIINTTEGKSAIGDSFTIRRTALQHKVTYTTTMAGARATILAIKALDATDVNCLQNLHKELHVEWMSSESRLFPRLIKEGEMNSRFCGNDITRCATL